MKKKTYFYIEDSNKNKKLIRTKRLTELFSKENIYSLTHSKAKEEFITTAKTETGLVIIEIFAKVVHTKNKKDEKLDATLDTLSASVIGKIVTLCRELFKKSSKETSKWIEIKNTKK